MMELFTKTKTLNYRVLNLENLNSRIRRKPFGFKTIRTRKTFKMLNYWLKNKIKSTFNIGSNSADDVRNGADEKVL